MPEGETHPFDIRHIKCHLIAGTAVSRCGFILFLPASLWVSLTSWLKNGESFLFTLHGKQTILQLAEEHGHCRKQTALNSLGGILQTFSPFISRKGFCYSFYLSAYRSVSCVRVGALSQKSASELWDSWPGCGAPTRVLWTESSSSSEPSLQSPSSEFYGIHGDLDFLFSSRVLVKHATQWWWHRSGDM